MDQEQRPRKRRRQTGRRSGPAWATLREMIGRWHQRHQEMSLDDDDDDQYRSTLLKQVVATFAQLSVWAKPCLEAHCLPHGMAVPKSTDVAGTSGGGSVNHTAQLEAAADALSFLRSVSQCAEVGLELCMDSLRRHAGDHAQSVAKAIAVDILDPMRTHLWTILAAIEPTLFWDPRPFWQTQHLRNLWSIYVRLWFLACFDQYPRLKAEATRRTTAIVPEPSTDACDDAGQDDDDDDYNPTDPRHGRRPLHTMQGLGLDGMSASAAASAGEGGMAPVVDEGLTMPHEIDAESWSMSELFVAIDVLTDRWPLVRYGREVVRLIGRILLRYANLAYIVSDSPTSAHDLCEYVDERRESVSGTGGRVLGMLTRSVRYDAFYGEGGAALRDMLSDLCVVTHADAWMWALSPTVWRRQQQGEGDDPSGPAMETLIRRRAQQALSEAPLARRLWMALSGRHQPTNDAEADGQVADPLMWLCLREGILDRSILQPPQARQSTADRADAELVSHAFVEAVAAFLRERDSDEAFRTFASSGTCQLLRPGELWRFGQLWSRYACTPINVLNGMRDRDLMRYNEMVSHARLPHRLAEDPVRALPGDLVSLLDHLMLECFRYIMRKQCSDQATDALPRYLIEKHHMHSAWALDCPTPWDDVLVWCGRMMRSESARDLSMLPPSACWEERAMERLANGARFASDIPPWPKIIMLGGRVFLWNPLGAVCAKLFTLRPERDPAVLPPSEQELSRRRRMCAELLDVSDLAMAGTLVLWQEARIMVAESMRDALLDLMDLSSSSDGISSVLSIATCRVEAYHGLMQWMLGRSLMRSPSPSSSDDDDDDPLLDPSTFV